MTDTTSSENTESADNGSDKYMVPALERGLRLLQEFGRGNATLGAPELARRLQLSRGCAARSATPATSWCATAAPSSMWPRSRRPRR
jgi:hypothetical protein